MRHEVEQYNGYKIVYDEGPTSWGAVVEGVPGLCFTVADTREECARQIHDALAAHLDALRKDMQERPWLYDEHAPEARRA